MITIPQIRIMAYLWQKMDISKLYEKEFSKQTGYSKATICYNIAKIEQHNWLWKQREGRNVSVWLTEKGRKIAENSYNIIKLTEEE